MIPRLSDCGTGEKMKKELLKMLVNELKSIYIVKYPLDFKISLFFFLLK